MNPKFVGDGYNRKENYKFIWAWYEGVTVGTVYTKLEERQDVFINGNDDLFPLTVKSFGQNVLVVQRLRGEISGASRTPILCHLGRIGSTGGRT